MATSCLLLPIVHIFVVHLGFPQVFGTLFIENTKTKIDPKYLSSVNVTYDNVTDTTNITIHAYLIRKLNYKIMVGSPKISTWTAFLC
jgi:hypothetical protein